MRLNKPNQIARQADIYNVIFDLGGVLIDWRPDTIADLFSSGNPDLRRKLMHDVLRHPDWMRMDTGALTEPQAAAKFARRTGLPSSSFLFLFETVRKTLVPIPGTLHILQDLHSRGVPCYCLSNIPDTNYAHLRKHYTFFRLFSGITVSHEVRLGKPDLKIYRHTLNAFGLDPARTVFIDDSPRNTAAAQFLGMRAILFHNPGQCRAELSRLGAF